MTADGDHGATDREHHLDRVIADYMAAAQLGGKAARDAFVKQHPEFAHDLRSFFADEDLLHSENQPAPALTPGSTFQARYQVISLKGKGGFGEVYQALDTKMQRIVAIKLLSAASLDRNPRQRVRFQREITASATLDHPHIVTIFDADCTPGKDGFIVMEFMAGGSFMDLTRERGAQPWEFVVRHAVALCGALDHIHQRRFVHRDIKPANIMFSGGDRERAKIGDLGIAHVHQGSAGLLSATEPGTQPGTLLWMAPEQLQGEAPVPQTDIYSFGATLYFMLTGRMHFPIGEHAAPGAVIASILNAPAYRLKDVVPGVPSALCEIVHRCLEKDVAKRIPCAKELGGALSALAGAGPAPVILLQATSASDYREEVRAVIRCRRTPRLLTPDDFREDEARPGDVWISPIDGAEMVFVPGGPFMMGSNEGALAERPSHSARTGAYLIDKYPVTNARYKRFLDAFKSYPVPRCDVDWGEVYNWDPIKRTFPPGQDDYPVIMVTHDDARAYAAWAGKRLPTEAQWEKAAAWDPSTGTSRKYPWGDHWDSARANSAERVAGRSFGAFKSGDDPAYRWFQEFRRLDPHAANSHELLTKVHVFPQGASALGVMDMAGNVHEWCELDGPLCSYGGRPYPGVTRDDLAHVRPCRGGAWADHPFYLRTSSRYAVRSDRYDRIGFRCVAPLLDVNPGIKCS